MHVLNSLLLDNIVVELELEIFITQLWGETTIHRFYLTTK